MWLAAILGFGILTLWVPDRWALSAYQVALFVTAAVRIGQRRSLTLPFAGWMIAGVAAWGALQVAAGWSVDRVTTLDAALNWVTNLAAFTLAADLYRNRDRRELFLRSTLIFATILAVVSIFTFLTSPSGKVFWIFDSGSGSRTLGPFVYQNQYAAFVEAVLPLAILGMMNDRRRWALHDDLFHTFRHIAGQAPGTSLGERFPLRTIRGGERGYFELRVIFEQLNESLTYQSGRSQNTYSHFYNGPNGNEKK